MREKILVIKTGAIGDVLMTTPFLRSLRKAFPDSKITYVVGEWSKEPLEGNSDVDEIITFDQNIVFKGFFPTRMLKVLSLSGKLKKRCFDIAFIMDKSYMAGIFAWLCGIKERVGFSRGWEGFANTKNVKYQMVRHEIDYYLDLLKFFTDKKCSREMNMTIKDQDKTLANGLRKKLGKRKLIGISAGGGNPGRGLEHRAWPKENFTELTSLINKKGWTAVALGTQKDKLKDKYAHDMCGRTTLKQAAAIIKICDALVTTDSGLMHVASAMTVPVISIFGPTDPRRKAPLNKSSVYLWKGSSCTRCELYGRYCNSHPGTEEITPGNVMKALNKLL